jgi:hypothetical protein
LKFKNEGMLDGHRINVATNNDCIRLSEGDASLQRLQRQLIKKKIGKKSNEME